MSIDAKVECVYINEDGSGRLELIDSEPGRIAGQKSLSFDSAPEEVTALNGCIIWGGSESIILGDVKIADRVGYTKIKFVDSEIFKQAVSKYNGKETV